MEIKKVTRWGDAVDVLCVGDVAVLPAVSGARVVDHDFSLFLERNRDRLDQWKVSVESRPDGTKEIDDGYLGGRVDTKETFHYRPRLIQALQSMGTHISMKDYHFLQQLDHVFNAHRDLARVVLAGMHPYFSDRSFMSAVDASWETEYPTTRPVLRSLWYPKQKYSVVGRPHYDRDFLTIHAGGHGGCLVVWDRDGEVWRKLELQPGSAALFLGARAERVGFSPTIHAALGETSSRERSACVSFWHLTDPEPMWDAPAVPEDVPMPSLDMVK